MFENIVGTGCSFVKDNYKHKSKLHFLHLLGKEFNCRTYNVGMPGLSNDGSYFNLIEWMNNNTEKVGSTLFIIGITEFLRIHIWNNIINNYDTLWMGPHYIKNHAILQNLGKNSNTDDFPNLCDLENKEKIQSFIDIYIKYFYNETFFKHKLEQKLIFLHNSIENQGGKLILFNSLDNFEPNTKKLNFLDLRIHENQKINNWKTSLNKFNKEKIRNDINEWNFHGHPGWKAHSWLSEKIINFLGEQNG
jgi:hypothetical protein